MGLELFVPAEADRLPTITTVRVPDGVDWKAVTGHAMKKWVYSRTTTKAKSQKPRPRKSATPTPTHIFPESMHFKWTPFEAGLVSARESSSLGLARDLGFGGGGERGDRGLGGCKAPHVTGLQINLRTTCTSYCCRRCPAY